jgi:hypothetical protein
LAWYVAVVGAAAALVAVAETAARGVTRVATPSTIPADSRVFLKRIMSCAPSCEVVCHGQLRLAVNAHEYASSAAPD